VQRKVAKTVKRLKNIGLLPHVGLLKPTDKINISTHIHDVEELNKRIIDPVTGRMFVKDKVQVELEREEHYKQKKFRERFERPDMDLEGDHEYSEQE